MEDDFLDEAADVAFARLREIGGDPRRLPEPMRVVATVFAAQGVIDNGGLRYFFGNDWPGDPPYSLFSAAYRLIGATAEADAIDAVARSFALPDPERDKARRCELMAGPLGAQLDEWEGRPGSDVWRLLADYARANRAAFTGGR